MMTYGDKTPGRKTYHCIMQTTKKLSGAGKLGIKVQADSSVQDASKETKFQKQFDEANSLPPFKRKESKRK